MHQILSFNCVQIELAELLCGQFPFHESTNQNSVCVHLWLLCLCDVIRSRVEIIKRIVNLLKIA